VGSTLAGILAAAWATLLLAVQPLAAWRGRAAMVERCGEARMDLYRGVALGILALGAGTLLLDLLTGRTALAALQTLPPASGAAATWLLPTLGALGVWLATHVLRRVRGSPPDRLYLHLLPRTRHETTAFAGISLLAGIAEEYAYRGFCLLHLRALTGSWAVAFALTTVGFGLGHLYQGPGGALRTGIVGGILALPVVYTGSLLPSVLAHAGVDLASGFLSYPLLRRWGLAHEAREESLSARAGDDPSR
jgi:membrane protease YdiL (CAAX protease family)